MVLKECHEGDKDDLSDAESEKMYAPQHILRYIRLTSCHAKLGCLDVEPCDVHTGNSMKSLLIGLALSY